MNVFILYLGECEFLEDMNNVLFSLEFLGYSLIFIYLVIGK